MIKQLFRNIQTSVTGFWQRFNRINDIPGKRIFLFLGIFIALLVIVNFSPIWLNVKYTFYRSSYEDDAPIVQTEKIEPNILVIESLNIKVPVLYVEEKNETAWQAALKNGVVHYVGTAKPGEYGNSYIFGHSSDYAFSDGKYKTVFALLPRIQSDAEIIVSDGEGNAYRYKVIETKVVSPNDGSVLDQQNHERRLLSVQTSYPIGTALRRFIVVAEMIDGSEAPLLQTQN